MALKAYWVEGDYFGHRKIPIQFGENEENY